MSPMTYLAIVNRAILESKVSLDPLTSVDFADPPRTILYTHFKNWVNDAYAELFEDRPEWFFRSERALISIWPRLYLGGVASTISVGDVLVGDSSGVEFTVMEVHTHEEAEQNLETEVTVSVEFTGGSEPASLIVRESITRTSPTLDADIAFFQDVGRYDFSELVSGLDTIDPQSIRAYDPNATTTSNFYPVVYVPWSNWPYDYNLYPWAGEYPHWISETPQGSYALYPQPEEQINLGFDYTRRIDLMELATDVPEALPDKYHMYLVWRTVMEFADYDKNPVLFSRARKHVQKYENYLERDQLQEVRMDTNRFYR